MTTIPKAQPSLHATLRPPSPAALPAPMPAPSQGSGQALSRCPDPERSEGAGAGEGTAKGQALLKTGFALLATIVTLASCSAPVSPVLTGQPAGGLPPAGEQAAELNIFNWDTYIDPAILDDFEQKYSVEINYDIYASNEDMLAAIQAGPTDYDIVVPSDYMVAIMRGQGLLAPLRKDRLPNFEHVDEAFLNPVFDPGNRYCAPYQWGTIGIGYNVRATGREISSWADLFDPAFAGRVALLDDARGALGVVLLYLGYSPNTTNVVELQRARDFLKQRSSHIAAFVPDTGQDLLVAGDVDLVLEWSGDIFQVMENNPDIRYVIPNEGSIIWSDNMCILSSAPHPDLAEKFINYILEPEVGAALSSYVRYASPNRAALPLLPVSDRNDPALYPSDEVRQRLFFLADNGPEAARLFEQAWADILAAHTH